MFYHSVVSSVIFYAAVCWGSRLKTADTNRLNKLIRRPGSVLGVELESVAEVSERRMLRKLLSISHLLYATLTRVKVEARSNDFTERVYSEGAKRLKHTCNIQYRFDVSDVIIIKLFVFNFLVVFVLLKKICRLRGPKISNRLGSNRTANSD
ncbi:hypothetical protein L3Q82_002282 [Scortum barcoo]|uniref:Uncharacterized protein n=1 Tax=Scortum barcoo TaxID=214431 RepID=A0ACB8VYH9_9TELE|nr:hypothetical protein L3Q82_002282 [Scortum barcoo]